MTHLDGRLGGLTMGLLFMQVVTPFATRVITGEGAFQLRFGGYVLVQLVSAALFSQMVREVRRHHLYREDTPPDLFHRNHLDEVGLAAGFLVSVPVWFVTPWAYPCRAAGPLALRVVRRWLPADG